LSQVSISIGIIGAGMISQLFHMPYYSKIPRCKITAICDSRIGLLNSVGDKHAIPGRYTHHSDMFASTPLDAAIIVTPRTTTGPIVKEALSRGISVLSEKPMAHTLEQAQKLVACANDNSTPYALGFMKRHDPGVKACLELFKDLFTSGEIGNLIHIQCHDFCAEYGFQRNDFIKSSESRPQRLDTWPSAPDWLPQSDSQDYEWFLNVVSHDLNLLRYFLGNTLQPVSFYRYSGKSCSLGLQSDGVPISLSAGKSAIGQWDQGITFYFEHGKLTLTMPSPMDNQGIASIELFNKGEPQRQIQIPPDKPIAFNAQAQNFINHLTSGEPLLCSGEESLNDMSLIETIWSKHNQELQ
jgi:predicted dehydrogenase